MKNETVAIIKTELQPCQIKDRITDRFSEETSQDCMVCCTKGKFKIKKTKDDITKTVYGTIRTSNGGSMVSLYPTKKRTLLSGLLLLTVFVSMSGYFLFGGDISFLFAAVLIAIIGTFLTNSIEPIPIDPNLLGILLAILDASYVSFDPKEIKIKTMK